ncbi:hypothetical protein BH18ACT2_BH18ACT2_20750 [soil metagenome]
MTHHDPTDADLDELYWRGDLTVAEIADLVTVPARNLHRRVTPLDAGVTCYRCAGRLNYESRAQLDGWWLRCPACGTSRRNPRSPDRPMSGPAAVGGTVVVQEANDIGLDIEACVDALIRAGVAWDEQSLVVLDHDVRQPVLAAAAAAATTIVGELDDLAPATLAVASLGVLGDSQTERLQALFVLTRRRWRVVAADDVRGYERSELLTSRTFDDDHLGEPYDEHDARSPSWAEHLVEITRLYRHPSRRSRGEPLAW